jgi:hypothetical protein
MLTSVEFQAIRLLRKTKIVLPITSNRMKTLMATIRPVDRFVVVVALNGGLAGGGEVVVTGIIITLSVKLLSGLGSVTNGLGRGSPVKCDCTKKL